MVRIGTVSYLNAAPLTELLDRARYSVIADHPRGIAARLAAGEVDVALVPVAAVLADTTLALVPGVCVGADGPVASVVIAADTEPEQWTHLLLDTSSRTSVTLARLLIAQGPLAARVRPDLQLVEVPPHTAPAQIAGTVAAVVIGDPARELPASLKRWDLAELWKAWTGLPFVFAVWAAPDGLPAEVRADLRAAGLAGVASLAERHAGDDLAYLSQNIRYALDEPALMGLRRFAALAHRAGLAASDLVRFLDPAPARLPRGPTPDALLTRAAEGERITPEEAARLWSEAPLADLQVAAHTRRLALHGRRATWMPVTQEAVPHLAGAVAVWLPDEAAAPLTEARVAAARSEGLLPLGLELATAASARVAPLTRAGLCAAVWTVGERVPEALQAAAAAQLPVHASIVLHRLEATTLLAALQRVREAQEATHALLSVTVHLPLPVGSLVEPERPSTATWLRAVALTRLFLDSVPHVSASPATQGLELSQLALSCGADDLGLVGASEVRLPAGAEAFPAEVDETERVLRAAGFTPELRDPAFVVVGGPRTQARRVRPVEARAAG